MKERRIGRFRVAEKLLREAVITGHGANLFVGCVPLDITRNWLTGDVDFLVWHPAFDAIPECEVVPEYVATFANGSAVPTWTRKGSAT